MCNSSLKIGGQPSSLGSELSDVGKIKKRGAEALVSEGRRVASVEQFVSKSEWRTLSVLASTATAGILFLINKLEFLIYMRHFLYVVIFLAIYLFIIIFLIVYTPTQIISSNSNSPSLLELWIWN